jgi:GntR family transcriptional regulator
VFFNINTSNGVPVYEQIARQIVFAVANRGIETGQLVPSVRNLSRELAVNPNTVARAYRQLQDQGVLETVRGEGLVVTKGAAVKCKSTRKKLIGDRILSVLQEARQSQLTEDDIKSIFADSLAASKKLANKNRTRKES